MHERPELTPTMFVSEFRRWYWTMAELRALARTVEIAASGSKADLTDRIGAYLIGDVPLPTATKRQRATPLIGPVRMPGCLVPLSIVADRTASANR